MYFSEGYPYKIQNISVGYEEGWVLGEDEYLERVLNVQRVEAKLIARKKKDETLLW